METNSLVTASRRISQAVLVIPRVDLPLETEPVVEDKDLGDLVPMEGRRLGGSGRIRRLEMRPGEVVRLVRLGSFPDTTGRLPEWDGPSKKTLPSAGD